MGRASDQQGFTLVELLVGMLLGLLVMGAVANLLEGAYKLFLPDQDRAQAAEEPLAGAARMVRELRGADQVVDMTGNAVDVIVSLNGQLLRVRYDCDVAAPDNPANPYDDTYRRCVRREAAATPGEDPPALPALSAGVTVIDRICPGTSSTSCDSAAAAPVFTCHSEDGTTIGACAQLPPDPIDPDDIPEADDDPPEPKWPTHIAVHIDVPERGDGTRTRFKGRVSFDDGLYLRNVDLRYAGAAS